MGLLLLAFGASLLSTGCVYRETRVVERPVHHGSRRVYGPDYDRRGPVVRDGSYHHRSRTVRAVTVY